ncbi:hypothetical protein EMPS_03842 [Entomortierella parvispora]|uniref:F-box domain-containing protein n=1 Tax=Entomortierella parvispora TaxID=205924 RepID=A0A9P3H856_9FUNG|nr:hypothetical protein EMPS_03842 [Entomortierella parvispora]
MTHPIDIPEIVANITLTKGDLFACIQVSHSWHNAFLATLWRHIHLKKSDTDSENNDALFQSLQRRADLIHTLAVDSIYPKSDLHYLELYFPLLKQLDLGFVQSNCNDLPRKFARSFLFLHGSHLQSLTVRNMLETRSTIGYEDDALDEHSNWEVLDGCKSGALSRLCLKKVDLVFDDMDDGSRQMLMGLDTLILVSVAFTSSRSRIIPDFHRVPQWPHRLTGCKIRHLAMIDCVPVPDQYQLLLDCSQELRSLEWKCLVYSSLAKFNPPLARDLKAGHWKNLESLSLRMNSLGDEVLAEILGAVGPLKDLVMGETAFGPSCTRALLDSDGGKHRATLESLSLSSCSNLEGSMVQEMLCSLPRLQRIRARELTLQSIQEDPRPWVCLGLKDFRLALVIHSGDLTSQEQASSQQTAFLDRLAMLRSLEVLELRRTFSLTGFNLYYQDLHLDKGLHRLWGLQNMRELRMIEQTGRRLGIEEAQWMTENWPRLKTVYLWRTPSTDSSDPVGSYFTDHGVKCYWKGVFPSQYNAWTF